MEAKEEDFSSLSITDKLQHKLWKARVSACEDLTKLFKTTTEDTDFYSYESCLKKLVLEPNAVAQEAGLSAVIEYVSNAPNATSTRDSIIPALVEKCLGAIKAGTKQKATDIILLYAEIDTPDPIVELVLPGINAKQPKLVTQTVFVLKELIRQFGIKKVNPKPIIKIIPQLFGHTDKNVRAEAFALTVELYRWIGQPLSTSLTTLKPVQIKDLEEAFSKLPTEKPTPERLIRSEQASEEPEQVENDIKMGDDAQDEEQMDVDEIDAFDLADPIDITAKLPGNFYELLQSKKWQERREALDALLEQAKTPKIMDKDYSELIGALSKRINDSNILLVGATATCIEHIATGLRTDFGKYKPNITPVMIEKLKERKPAILEQLANGLNAVFASVPISELIEDVTVASKHKNPQVRSECFKLLSRRLKEVKEMPGKTEIKSFAEMFKKLLDDADANAREAGADGLGTLMKLIGEKPMLPFTDGLSDIQMGKIKEAYEKATVKVKIAKKPQPSIAPPVKKAPTMTKKPTPEPMTTDDTPTIANDANSVIPPKRKPPSRLTGASSIKKPALSSSKPKTTTAPTPSAVTGSKKSAKLPPPSTPEEIKYKYSQEDAEARATEFIPEAIHTDLQQAQWKVRLAAMESLCQHFEEIEGSAIEPEIVIRSFSKKPGWKEMNFQVMGKMFSAIQTLSVKCPSFNKACGALCIPVMVEKLGDIKLKKPAGDCLVTIAEKTSVQFVFSQAYPVLKKAKSPKVLSDSFLWIHATLMDFGIYRLQVRDLIDLIKFGLSNTNASVRTSAVTVLGALRQFIGPEIKSFVEDVSPALLATIEQEFEKVSKMDPPQPTKAPKNFDGDDSGGDIGSTNADAIDSLFPRVDISGSLSKTITQCADANWKIRKEGLDKVMEIITSANNRIKPSLGPEFPNVLKQRLNDSNKNLQIMAVEIAGTLSVAMGKPFEKYIKLFTGPVIAVLSDNKANVRSAGITTLENFRKTCSMELMAPVFGTSLANETPTLRKELLSWISTAVKEEPDVAKFDFTSIVIPLFSCLQDRNGDVRKAAQVCLPEIIAIVGYDNIINKTTELKAAQRQTILPLIEAARGSAPMATNPSTAAASTASTAPTSKKRPESIYATDDHGRSSTISTPSRLKTPLKKKMIGVPASRSQATSHATASVENSIAPILTNDSRAKQIRAKKEIRWQFDSPRPDIIDNLKTLFDANMSPEVTSLLFSKSQHAERDRLNGLSILNDCLTLSDICIDKYHIEFTEMKCRFVANADLIFKYLTIRFFDTNTSMLIKCLDLTQNLVNILEEENYHLTEYEAVSFLPYLINKVGDPKEVMRARVREILNSLSRIYPPNKLFNYLLDAVANSKNSKVRSECLEEVGLLIQRNGISVMHPNKSLPIIATHIGDRDSSVRNAALNAVAQAYILIGDPVMKYMTRLGDKEKSMLEERLKRTTPSASVLAAEEKERAKQKEDEMEIDELLSLPRLTGRSQIAKPRNIISPQRPVSYSQTLPEPEPMEDVIEDHRQRIPEPHANRINPEIRQIRPVSFGSQQHSYQPRFTYSNNPTEMLDYLLSQMNSSNQTEGVDALKGIVKIILAKPQAAISDVGRIINGVTLQMKMAALATDPQQGLTPRLCKHVVNILVSIFSTEILIPKVPVEGLQHLLEQLARQLLDQKTNGSASGPQLSKALNVAMVKILENSERNHTFSALLTILSNGSERLLDRSLAIAQESKYVELIMKCLWKLAKTIQDSLKRNILNPDELLLDINRFFLATPPTTWKQRAAAKVPLGEMPLRTVKTLLLELVNGLGDSVFRHLTLIDNPQDSHVYPYLLHMLEACRKKEQEENPYYQQQQQQQRLHQQQLIQHQQEIQQQQQQLQQMQISPTRTEETIANRLASHSHNSPLSRSASISSVKSNTVIRSPSVASHFSNDGEQQQVDNHLSPLASNQSPHLSSSILNNIALTSVHPMQIGLPTVNDYAAHGLTDYDLNVKLTKIFQKIGNRDYTKQGIIELYDFQKNYPNAQGKVNNYLGQTGTYFQSYIRRGLSNLEAEDNELHAQAQAQALAQAQAQAQAQTQLSTGSITPTPTNAITKDYVPYSPVVERQQHMVHNNSERSSFESPQSRNDNANGKTNSLSEDNTAEIKLRFLRLQQKFGYKTNIEDNNLSSRSGPTSLSNLDPGSSNNLGKIEMSSTFSSFSPRKQLNTNHDGETDRQQSVSALKEKLAKMKQVINSATSSQNL
ncbi:armadillo-type protein [Cokeromyces recurvatus]|uniref:armadillo-type protein n=1 Tax=Cokeromyces recurvatus TaxID=90255 RepID=UPI00221EC0E3|nr:armadillo-type protein [Cokeromyces recurvatus]KAI7908148.1 armadillo-type protein [Cokeromyces recurvatus]